MMRTRTPVVAAASAVLCSGLLNPATANASEWVYLLNVSVRPVYGFANADQALSYGHGVCDAIRSGRSFGAIVGDLKRDFDTDDEFSASYLVSQAAQELCPDLIWQLRAGAGGYRPAT